MKKAEQLAAVFAYGCRRTKELGIDNELRKFVEAGDKRNVISNYLKQLEPYFYYRLIARANGIKNVFDQRVIEAYWIGNELLEKVRSDYINHILERAESKFKVKNEFLLRGGRVHHNYTVLAAVPVKMTQLLKLINNCLISWGKVKKLENSRLLVSVQPIILKHQQWFLGPWQKKKINKGFIKRVRVGDWVAIHFGEARQILSQSAYRQLRKYTQAALAFFNKRGPIS